MWAQGCRFGLNTGWDTTNTTNLVIFQSPDWYSKVISPLQAGLLDFGMIRAANSVSSLKSQLKLFFKNCFAVTWFVLWHFNLFSSLCFIICLVFMVFSSFYLFFNNNNYYYNCVCPYSVFSLAGNAAITQQVVWLTLSSEHSRVQIQT